jgi:hypothetical protein
MLASGAAHAGGALNDLVAFFAAYWWLFFIFGGAISSFFAGVRDFLLGIARYVLESGERRHQRRLEVIREQHGGLLPIGVREDGEVITAAVPRACPHPHRYVEEVRSGGELVAYLCTKCDTQLPLDREEIP